MGIIFMVKSLQKAAGFKGRLPGFRRSTVLFLLIIFFSTSLSIMLSSCGSGVSGAGQTPDAVVQDLPIAYVKRDILFDAAGNLVSQDLRLPMAFHPGAHLILRDAASPSAIETNITDELFDADALYDVKDLNVSSDGKRLVFALRAPEIENAEIQPTWNIWEYQIGTKILQRIIQSDLVAEQGEDTSPAYLPDGRIVFSSTRQATNKSILLDEGKPQYSGLDEDRRVAASVLHVMNRDGTDSHQISFNQSHDIDPEVMQDGKIVFTRWDNASNRNGMHLYRVNPDGRHLEILYGNHSHDTGTTASGTNDAVIQFTRPREMPDGKVLTLTRGMVSRNMSGVLTLIDVQNFTENHQKVNDSFATTESAQLPLTPTDVTNDGSISKGGYYAGAYPLFDGSNRLLVSWSLCRLQGIDSNNQPLLLACSDENLADSSLKEAAPLYGIWMLNLENNTLLPVITGDEGFIYQDVVSLQPKNSPTFIPNGQAGIDLEQSLVDDNLGVLHIRSVYDFDGEDLSPKGISQLADPLQTTADQRPARFLRLIKAVSIPDRELVQLNDSAFGRSRGQLMREILGYTPIEPDGSVTVKIPANVPFSLSILDKNGARMTQLHRNWLQLKPGEQRECHGCHTRNSELPHGRNDAELASINVGATINGAPFPNTNPALIADAGETMAQTKARIKGLPALTADIIYEDEWTDQSLSTKNASFSYQYSDLTTPLPITASCLSQWAANCRISINYEANIQPIWQLPRMILDSDGVTVLADNTCTSCHAEADVLSVAQVPAAQLDLSGTPSIDNPDLLTSYRELFFSDNEQELVDGVLVDRLIPLLDVNGNPVFEVDDNGQLILDEQGNPIPVMVTVGVAPALTVSGARSNSRLFDLFQAGGSHSGWLSDAEKKLITEWLDIGAQTYNNPFDVPQN